MYASKILSNGENTVSLTSRIELNTICSSNEIVKICNIDNKPNRKKESISEDVLDIGDYLYENVKELIDYWQEYGFFNTASSSQCSSDITYIIAKNLNIVKPLDKLQAQSTELVAPSNALIDNVHNGVAVNAP